MEKIKYPEGVNLSEFSAENTNPRSLYGLPTEVRYCSECVISNQRPNSAIEYKHSKESKKKTINFDNAGVYDACRFSERKKNSINWLEREQELKELCDKHRKSDGSYDCIVPGSGGKDSFYASHILRNKYGMHPGDAVHFVHSYMALPREDSNLVAYARFGGHTVPAVLSHRYTTGCQFHPEKSGVVGLSIIENFVNL